MLLKPLIQLKYKNIKKTFLLDSLDWNENKLSIIKIIKNT